METILSKALGPGAVHLVTEEKRRLLARLVARLAHEVRNPLSSLDIHVQLLQEDLARKDTVNRDQMSERLAIIRGELKRLEEIVENFLRLSGPSEFHPAPLDVAALVERVFELVEPEASSRQIHIAVKFPVGLPVLWGDAGQLTQAVLNVVLNALQAIQREGRIEIQARPDGDHSLRIEVRDSGPGVARENQAAIFEPYFTTKQDGTGLGLWIAQQIVAAHGGTLEVADAPDGGALFTFCLPLRLQPVSHGKAENPNSGGG